MATLSAALVRSRVAAPVAALTGWTLSRYVYDLFGADARSIAHKNFVAGVVSTAPKGGRQRLTEGAYVESLAVLRYSYRIRTDAQVSDYDAALDAQGALIAAVMGSIDQAALQIRFSGVPLRQVETDPQGGLWLLVAVRFAGNQLVAIS